MPDDLGVESIPGQPDARVAEKIGGCPAALPNRGPDANQGKITGAAAEVSDQNELVAVECGFIVACGRDRFEFEVDAFKASFAKRFSPAAFSAN